MFNFALPDLEHFQNTPEGHRLYRSQILHDEENPTKSLWPHGRAYWGDSQGVLTNLEVKESLGCLINLKQTPTISPEQNLTPFTNDEK